MKKTRPSLAFVIKRKCWYAAFVLAPIAIVVGAVYPALLPDNLEVRFAIIRSAFDIAAVIFFAGMTYAGIHRLARQDQKLADMQARIDSIQQRHEADHAFRQAIPDARSHYHPHLAAVDDRR